MNNIKNSKWFHIKWIAGVWKNKAWLIALLFVLTLISSAVAVVYPYLSKLLLDMIQRLLENPTSNNPMSEVNKMLLIFVSVGVGGLIASFFPGVRGATNSIFEHAIRTKYFNKILTKNYTFFNSFPSADITTRLTNDIYDYPRLSWFLCSGIFRAVESISKTIFCITAMFLIDSTLTWFAIIPLPIMLFIFYYAEDRIYDTFKKNQEAVSNINTKLEMSFAGVRVIKAYACEHKYMRFFNDALDTRWKTEMSSVKLDTIMTLVYRYIEYAAQIAILFAGGIMAINGKITVGTFYAFYTYLAMLIYPMLDIPQLFTSGKRAFVNIDRLEELFNFDDKQEQNATIKIDSIDNIKFDKISFSYESSNSPSLPKYYALDNISFEINRKEKIAVIGPVGSGKTTLVKIILGLLPYQNGSVRVNGIELNSLDIDDYRQKLAYVPQEALLFSGTIRDNVNFGGALYDEAIDIAQLKDEIDSFTAKDDTDVGARGENLSGGQKQRVAIARAISAPRDLLLFDDITASLDASNEEKIMQKLDEKYKDLGMLIVSHRLSTLQYVDKILFLNAGTIVGFGTHLELLSNNSYKQFISEHMNCEN